MPASIRFRSRQMSAPWRSGGSSTISNPCLKPCQESLRELLNSGVYKQDTGGLHHMMSRAAGRGTRDCIHNVVMLLPQRDTCTTLGLVQPYANLLWLRRSPSALLRLLNALGGGT